MRKSKLLIFLLLFCTLSIGIWYSTAKNNKEMLIDEREGTAEKIGTENVRAGSNEMTVTDNNRFYRNVNTIDFSGLTFTPWDVNAASSLVDKREKKPYTIMVYMNGSDLESEGAAATSDLIEMLESGVSAEFVNIIIFTGGTNRWQNDVIPSNSCAIWEIENGLLYEVARIGLVNMGDPGTLASFIDFSVNNFPAEKYGLIMWDHGGGSIAGYGHDEKFAKNNLTLLDMNYAFQQSVLSKNKLEFLGFDSCLMATVEMAVVASDYSNYLIASEDLEPGDGWDYGFLAAFNGNPSIGGAELGREIINRFMEYYGEDSGEILTLSVIDLSNIGRVTEALENLMKQCSGRLLDDRRASFNVLARKRSRTKTFGAGSPRDNECDMVDIGDMSNKLSDLYPDEAANIIRELGNCVIYNRNNSDVNLNGLSVYYIYGTKEFGNEALDTYKSLKVNDEHTKYLDSFYSMLKAGVPAGRYRSSSREDSGNSYSSDDIIGTNLTLWQPVSDREGSFIMTGIRSDVDYKPDETVDTSTLWPTINGKNVCLYTINNTKNSSLYAIPATLNGRDCDIVVLFSEKYPEGKIMGVRQEDGIIIQKGYDAIKDGDKISFYYEMKNSRDSNEDTGWYKSDEFTVKGKLKIEWSKLRENGSYYYSFQFTDVRDNKFFADFNKLQTKKLIA